MMAFVDGPSTSQLQPEAVTHSLSSSPTASKYTPSDVSVKSLNQLKEYLKQFKSPTVSKVTKRSRRTASPDKVHYMWHLDKDSFTCQCSCLGYAITISKIKKP